MRRRQNSGPNWGPSPRIGTVQTWRCTTIMTPPEPSYKRGDVVLVLYPNSDLRTAKTRPALIVQVDNIQTGLSQVIVAIDRVIGTLPMTAVDTALRHTLKL